MIALGQISLQHRTSMYDARKKIRGLANALGYDPIEATRLATAVSDAARRMQQDTREPRIAVALAMEFSPPQLVLDFECRGEIPEVAGLVGFFDSLSQRDTRDGFQSIRALKRLPNQAFDAMQSTIARQKLAAYPPDVTIEIPRNACGTLEFDRAAEMIDLGRHKARNCIAQARKQGSA